MGEEQDAGVRAERRGPVAVWTVDRPDRMNSLARETVRRIGRLARRAATDREVRAVVITGAGDRAFSAGADLKERRGMDTEDVRDMLALYQAAFGYVDRLPKPVVAAINGVAFGGGLELALACDLRVMAPHAEVGLTEVSLGIIPGAGGTQRLTRVVGPAKAKELVLLSRRLGAPEARALGVVHEVAPEGRELLDFTLEWIDPLARGAPLAVAAALDAIDAAADLPLDAGLLKERECYERTLESKDRLEALEAFAQKRPPIFKGE